MPRRAAGWGLATALLFGAGCSKECDGIFYCPDLGSTVATDSRDEADATCRRRTGLSENPDGGSFWCICSCEN
jgi:hypothetical protein